MAQGHHYCPGKAAEQVAFGDDKRKTTTYFKGELAKSLARNRTTTTDQAKAAREYELYLKSQDALGKNYAPKIAPRTTFAGC